MKPDAPERPPFGRLLCQWRRARGLTQRQLARQAAISARHLNFVETGKGRASRDLVLNLASVLGLSPRDRNAALAAAGFAPIHPEADARWWGTGAVALVLDLALEKHEPYPALVVDRAGHVVKLNKAAAGVLRFLLEDEADAPANAFAPGVNVYRLFLEPGLVRACVTNWKEFASTMALRLRGELSVTSSDTKAALVLEELIALAGRPDAEAKPHGDVPPVVPLQLSKSGVRLRLLGTIAAAGTVQDATLQALHVVRMYPQDADTTRWLRSRAPAAGPDAADT